MKIDHVALYVNDLEAARDFFLGYFGAECGPLYHNTTTGFHSYFLSFGDGARLELMHRPGLADPPKAEWQTGFTHLSFSAGSPEGVDTLTRRLQEAGYKVISGPRLTGDGYYESCVLGPENNQIEIVA